MSEILKMTLSKKNMTAYRYIPTLHGVSVVTAVCNFEE